jgi:hypothetical protein
VTAGLDPLGDHKIAAGTGGGARFLYRTDLPGGQRARGVHDLN